jgi:TolA-binding protein
VKEAERVGFGTLEQNASPSDLLLLADVARLGGAPQRARSVLTSLRSRYPGHTNSAVAAFTLGRIAQEQEHDDRRAIQWYRTYLKEEPKGRMSEGARARLLKATLRVGSDAERDQAARDYLANHPTGSSAVVARSVLSK